MIARSSPKDAVAITLDAAFIPTSAIYVGTGGSLQVVMSSGRTALFTNVPGGVWFPVEAIQVQSSGTTASGLVAGYY